MKFTFSNIETKVEFLSLLSLLEKWCVDTSASINIKEIIICFDISDNKVDIEKVTNRPKNGIQMIRRESQVPEKESKYDLIDYDELSVYMFEVTGNFDIPTQLENELKYVGKTKPYYSNIPLNVYSIESFCKKHRIDFLKTENYDYVQKTIAKEIIPDLIDTLKVSAIYFERGKGLRECVNLKEVERAFNNPIFTKSNFDFPLVTRVAIREMIPFIKRDRPIGKLYEYFELIPNFNRNSFIDDTILTRLLKRIIIYYYQTKNLNEKGI